MHAAKMCKSARVHPQLLPIDRSLSPSGPCTGPTRLKSGDLTTKLPSIGSLEPSLLSSCSESVPTSGTIAFEPPPPPTSSSRGTYLNHPLPHRRVSPEGLAPSTAMTQSTAGTQKLAAVVQAPLHASTQKKTVFTTGTAESTESALGCYAQGVSVGPDAHSAGLAADCLVQAENSSGASTRSDQNAIRMFVTTFNMHGRDPPETLTSWLPENPNEFDLFVIGTQEAERSIEMSVLLPYKPKWEAKLRSALGANFALVEAHTLAAIHLIVFANKTLLPQISHVRSASVATGILNTIGNKGGVGISMQLGLTSAVFINSHFAAHQHAVAERNADYERIRSNLALRPVKSASHRPSQSGVDNFDIAIWIGDLNYRVDGNRAVVDKLLLPPSYQERASGHWGGSDEHWASMCAVLRANDQLVSQMSSGAVFSGFTEGLICFRPTYKYDVDSKTDTYDTSGKQRIPAYTDRILYRSHAAESLKLHRYVSCNEIRTSDHKPVVAEMTLCFELAEEHFGGQRPNKRRSRISRTGVSSTHSTSAVCAVM